MKTLIFLFLGGILSYAIALFWWQLWMNKGIQGPPDFLSLFIQTDGERVYNLKELEMFIFILVPITIVVLLIRYRDVIFR